jgi:hypothetical protein
MASLSPHFYGGLGFIFKECIVPKTYLKNCVCIALVITFKDLLDFHSFLLEVIGASTSSSLPFQAH